MIRPEPPRLSETPPATDAVADLVREVRREREWPREQQTALFWAARRRACSEAERRPWRLPLVFVGGLVAAAAVVVVALGILHRAPPVQVASFAPRSNAPAASWDRLDLNEIGSVEVSEGAGLQLTEQPAERQLHIEQGTLRAQVLHQDPLRPVVVVTPQLRIVVVGTRFDVQTSPGLTAVSVIEGRVRVEAGDAAVLVGAGESIRSDDVRLQPPAAPSRPAPLPAPTNTPTKRASQLESRGGPADPARLPVAADPTSVAGCNQLPSTTSRKRCWQRLTRGGGLQAQNALMSLGLLARDVEGRADSAIDYFELFQARFEDGVLAPDVTLELLQTLLSQNRLAEALHTAEEFESRFADDPRVDDVRVVRARLLCAHPEGRAQGLDLLDRVAASGAPSARAEAVDARRFCAGSSAD